MEPIEKEKEGALALIENEGGPTYYSEPLTLERYGQTGL